MENERLDLLQNGYNMLSLAIMYRNLSQV